MNFRISSRVTALILVAMVWSKTSSAYIPPSLFILKTWVKTHAEVKQIKVKSLVSLVSSDDSTPVHFKETSVFDSRLGILKSVITDDSGKNIYRITKNNEQLSPLSEVFFDSDATRLALKLKKFGIPIKTEEELLALATESQRIQAEKQFLVRSDQTVAWVIGENDVRREIGSQIWFEKDSFLPLRLIYSPISDEDWLNIKLENYRSIRSVPFPRTIKVSKKDGTPLLSIQVVEVAILGKDSKGDFLGSGTVQGGVGFTSFGESISNSSKDMIRLYYDIVR
jgi:hypothetical protein